MPQELGSLQLIDVVKYVMVKHRNQEYGDMPYSYHLVDVASRVVPKTETMQIYALLHDIFEDTDVTYKTLTEELGHDIAYYIPGLRTLTRSTRESYRQYIERLSVTTIPKAVKIADLSSNLFNSVNEEGELMIPESLRTRYVDALTFLVSC